MKINSVIVKTTIIINGVEYPRESVDWTHSITGAQNDGIPFMGNQDVFDWVELNED